MCGRKSGVVLGVCAILVVIFAVLTLIGFQSVFKLILDKEVPLTETSQSYPKWKNPEHITMIKFYFFNVTNPERVLAGDKPYVREVGPYTYRSRWQKINVTFNNNATVSYKEKKVYYFVRGLSVGPENDRVTTVNVPFVAVSQLLSEQSFIIRGVASLTLASLGQRVFISRTVGQLTFQGYPDILILLASLSEGPRLGEPGFNIADIFRRGYNTILSLLNPAHQGTTGKFGYMIDKNNSDDGLFTLFTGADNISKITQLNRWNGDEYLHVWKGAECNKLKGGVGQMIPPMSDTTEQAVFISDLCRSLPLKFKEMVETHGLQAKRFVAPKNTFASPEINPENLCYKTSNPYPSGVMDMGPCKKGAPLVLSFPHFLYADPYYSNSVEGLEPDPDRHSFYLDTEPTIGATVAVRGRVQISVVLKRVFGLGQFSRVREGVLPLFWQEIHVEAHGETLRFMKFIVNLPFYSRCCAIGIILLGAILLACAVYLIVRRVPERKEVKVQPTDINLNLSNLEKTSEMKNGVFIIPTKPKDDRSRNTITTALGMIPNGIALTPVTNNFINELKSSSRKNSETSTANEKF